MFTALFIEFNQNDGMANWYSALDRPWTLGLITGDCNTAQWQDDFTRKKMEQNRAKEKTFVSLYGDRVCLEDRGPALWKFCCGSSYCISRCKPHKIPIKEQHSQILTASLLYLTAGLTRFKGHTLLNILLEWLQLKSEALRWGSSPVNLRDSNKPLYPL